jgi:hypothetical protein
MKVNQPNKSKGEITMIIGTVPPNIMIIPREMKQGETIIKVIENNIESMMMRHMTIIGRTKPKQDSVITLEVRVTEEMVRFSLGIIFVIILYRPVITISSTKIEDKKEEDKEKKGNTMMIYVDKVKEQTTQSFDGIYSVDFNSTTSSTLLGNHQTNISPFSSDSNSSILLYHETQSQAQRIKDLEEQNSNLKQIISSHTSSKTCTIS